MQAVIFDMDGVLVNSEDAMKTTAIMSLERFGIKPKKSDFLEFTGMGEDAFIGGVARKYGLEYNTEMKDYAYGLYVEMAGERVYVYPGAREMILRLGAMGFRVAVASAADHIKVRTNLACIGVSTDDFHAVVTGSDVVHKKPDPEIFLLTAGRMGVEPKECIVLEDALSGLKAAKAAGMSSIGITTAFSAEDMETESPDYITEDLLSAFELILEWKAKRQ